MGDDADGVEVDLEGVHLLAEDLGRHVAGGAACVETLLGVLGPRDPEVREAQVAQLVEHQVLGLDVAVEDALLVDVLHRCQDAGDQEARLFLGESPHGADAVPQICAGEQIHDKIEVVPVVEGADHVGEEGRGEFL